MFLQRPAAPFVRSRRARTTEHFLSRFGSGRVISLNLKSHQSGRAGMGGFQIIMDRVGPDVGI